MMRFLPAPAGPFALKQLPPEFAPGCLLRVAGQHAHVLGTIVCADDVEAWLECYVRLGNGRTRWLAVETRSAGYHTTIWERAIEEKPPALEQVPGHAVQVMEGTASYRSYGDFGAFPIPAAGVLEYWEVTGAGAVAAERFAPGDPWLIGRGNGADIDVEAAGE